MDKRELTAVEMSWCRRLARVLLGKPQSLEIYVGQNTVDILPAGGINAVFEASGTDPGGRCLDEIGGAALYTIITKIEGDGSGT